jgi:hypothetical protein
MKGRLPSNLQVALLAAIRSRFDAHPERHPGLVWPQVEARLHDYPDRLWSLHEMERTGGEPEVTGHDAATGAVRFVDCSPQTPKGRTSVCYDRAGLESRKEHRPTTSAIDLAAEMGVTLLTEAEYLELQTMGEFDTKTSSWVLSTPDVRALGGALYGERRYGRVFIGHNGAQSYYAVRGFRAVLWV